MYLKTLITKYIDYRRSIGNKSNTAENHLKAYSRFMGQKNNAANIHPEMVVEFLYGTEPVTSNWFSKYAALRGFYQYAISRGYINDSPLPFLIPEKPPPFIPYIYTREELGQIFAAVFTFQKKRSFISPYMIHMLLLLLYGAGLRLSEALSLTMKDIDLFQAVITVRKTKFYKDRLVPFGCSLAEAIFKYINWKKKWDIHLITRHFFLGQRVINV